MGVADCATTRPKREPVTTTSVTSDVSDAVSCALADIVRPPVRTPIIEEASNKRLYSIGLRFIVYPLL
ncbi:hypothetical protein GCM10011273_22290 [Asticcacaulis endophyticus]|uniref:Uncharacterized protein n=1 Tax=Asticcacaulis endophyticus TaxID=1395890 RepID=A0A918Q6U3_9CAUL|nr:hypothetical protein GCM10011273_22290 [Asticcacaulis endophyticus]